MSCCYSNRGSRSFYVKKNAEKDEEMKKEEEDLGKVQPTLTT